MLQKVVGKSDRRGAREFVLTVKVWGKFIVTQVVCVSDCGCERQIFRAELGLIKADSFLPSVLRTAITI